MTKQGKMVARILAVVIICIMMISAYFIRRNSIISPPGGITIISSHEIGVNEKINFNLFDEKEIRGLYISWDNSEWIKIDTRQVNKLVKSIQKPNKEGKHKLKIKIGVLYFTYYYDFTKGESH